MPILADAVAVERRSGTLDLALTSPGARFYFERRVAAVAVLMIVAGMARRCSSRTRIAPSFPLSGAFLQIVIVVVFIDASYAPLDAAPEERGRGDVRDVRHLRSRFTPWLFSNPIHPPTEMPNGAMTLDDLIDYAQHNLVLAAAAAIFYLYALQRLSRPESIIQ